MDERKTDNKNTKTGMEEGMEKCMKNAKWVMLIPGFILISAFLLTYFLPLEVMQILWLVVTGTLIGVGLIFPLMISLWFRKST